MSELLFASRGQFRAWLSENAAISDGVWIVFGKNKTIVTLTANDALEEALCFGWIDGQMRNIDSSKYLKYFAKRRAKSHWSEKNKKIVGMLREKNLMTELGENAVRTATTNGTWDSLMGKQITDEQVVAFTEKLVGILPAYENFNNMSRSVRLTYTRRYLSFKSEGARQRDFGRIVDRLNQNLKPM
ncbi:MAG: hypothetical protein FWH51_04060 [Dehalococcoidia bacterium]|nr:hypothetical protein [Dehalococcoidia bacterium]